MDTLPIILASASPRRRELLTHMGLTFRVVPSGLEERPWPSEKPASYALRNAGDKGREVLDRTSGDGVVIAADTIVVLGDRILEKPADAREAAEMLHALSGCEHVVITGLVVLCRRGTRLLMQGDAVRTAVRFRTLSSAEIEAYVATGEPMDKAGAYAIQGGAAAFVEDVRGSRTNVVGLPVEMLSKRLKSITL
jgi:septum formation protein